MVYVLAALVLLAFGALLWNAWRKDHDRVALLEGVALVGVGVFLTSFARSMIVYKPLMVLHIAATMLFWYGLTRWLLRREVTWAFLAAPIVTAALFFLVAWIFREV